MQSRTEGYKLSPQQKRVWWLQGGNHSIRAQCGVLIRGWLDGESLAEALRRLESRHEILRTRFAHRSGIKSALQWVAESGDLVWEVVDLSGAEEAERRAGEERVYGELAVRRIDLERGPVLEAVLIKLGREEHKLLVSLPALCADRRSLVNLVKAISREYEEVVTRRPEQEQQEVQYLQYSQWCNELLEAEEADEGRQYWSKQTAGEVRFGGERKRGPRQEGGGGGQSRKVVVEIGAEERGAIERLAAENQVSVSDVMFVNWAVLMKRMSGQSEICIYEQMDGRKYEELEEGLGQYTKRVPVVVEWGEVAKYREVLREVSERRKECGYWQEYYEEEEEGDGGEERGGTGIGYEYREGAEEQRRAGVSFRVERQEAEAERYKIKLECERAEEGMKVEMSFDEQVLSEAEVNRLAGHYQELTRSAAQRPESWVWELEILSEEAKRELVWGLNQTRREYEGGKNLVERIKEQGKERGDSVAVEYEGEQVSYGEIERRANQLSRYLKRKGVKAEERVGICMERGVEMVVGLIGILKAGGAYVPIDASYPNERVSYMLEDSEARVVLTQSSLVKSLPAERAEMICIDSDWELIGNESGEEIDKEIEPENAAYVIYTSGSTGKPKGVSVEHRQLCNYLQAIERKLEFTPETSSALISTFAADLGNTVIFPSLANGGRLHVISENRASDPDALAEYFCRHPIDCLKIVPSHLAALLSSSKSRQILPRKYLVLGGEASRWDWVGQIRVLTTNCSIVNHYGPTEATVGVLTYPVRKSDTEPGSSVVPLGRPLDNTQIYLVDSSLRLVPFGVVGELCIGGASLARGYLHRPDLTAERFIPNPFGNEEGARIYKTGDLARYLRDGNIEFVGRIDHQVKIRGFRIELGEIETALRQHPAVREAVLLAREDAPSHKRLAAYVVAKSKSFLKVDELQDFLKPHLPDYMIPSVFVMLEALPLTQNGKIDRQALPVPDRARPEMEKGLVAPETPEEESLAAIWSKVLGLNQVGIHDNFFALGGDSILSVQVVALAKESGLSFSVQQLFQQKTIHELARVVERTAPAMETEEQTDQDDEELARILEEIERLSENEVHARLNAAHDQTSERNEAGDLK